MLATHLIKHQDTDFELPYDTIPHATLNLHGRHAAPDRADS